MLGGEQAGAGSPLKPASNKEFVLDALMCQKSRYVLFQLKAEKQQVGPQTTCVASKSVVNVTTIFAAKSRQRLLLQQSDAQQ